MKTRNLKNSLKIALLTIVMLAMGAVSAQNTSVDEPTKPDAVRVIDNKGTIKYLQTINGLTTFTNTAVGKTTTTWQLGGTLNSATDIDFNGQEFSFDNVLDVDTTDLVKGVAATTTADEAGTTTGWTILTRDEATGAINKLLATDLITSGQTELTSVDAVIDTDFTISGVVLPGFSQVYVYRNGAKLRANVDYTVAVVGTDSTITLKPVAAALGETQDWQLFATDILEVHYIK